ncbi:MAG TPA: hypothetical protein PLZ36_06005 [Armatimonadota bacterium]|nr:hypothetical protein [Armatimonadota bacterium]
MSRMLILCFALAGAALAVPPVAERTTTETLLVPPPPPVKTENGETVSPRSRNFIFASVFSGPQYLVSPNGKLLVHTSARKDGEPQTVFINGVPDKVFDKVISPIHCTRDDTPYYLAKKDARYDLVHGTREYGPYDGIKSLQVASDRPTGSVEGSDWRECDPNAPIIRTYFATSSCYMPSDRPAFSPAFALVHEATHRLAWVIKRAGKQHVVVDGVEGPPYDRIGAIAFSPDGKRLAYVAKQGAGWKVVVDGQPKALYDQIIPAYAYSSSIDLAFSRDSRHLAYPAWRGGRKMLVVDGRETTRQDAVYRREFAPPPASIAAGMDEGATVLFVRELLAVAITMPLTTPPPKERYPVKEHVLHHGGTWAFAAPVGKQYVVVVNGQESRRYDKIHMLGGIPHSPGVYYLAQVGKYQQMVMDGQAGNRYAEIDPYVVFSPNGKRAIYLAKDRGQQVVVVDGRETLRHSASIESLITFTPDSRHYSYQINMPDGRALVVDGRRGPTVSSLNHPVFAPDAPLVAYTATRYSRDSAVVNGHLGPTYHRIISRVFFDTPTKLHYFAIRDGAVYRVEETVTLKE